MMKTIPLQNEMSFFASAGRLKLDLLRKLQRYMRRISVKNGGDSVLYSLKMKTINTCKRHNHIKIQKYVKSCTLPDKITHENREKQRLLNKNH